jgi:hypothetical protein
VVSGVEKEYAIRKVAKMDFRGSGDGQVATTTGEGWQVERKLLLNEREMIWSMSKTFGTQRVADHEPFVEWDTQEPIGGSIILHWMFQITWGITLVI